MENQYCIQIQNIVFKFPSLKYQYNQQDYQDKSNINENIIKQFEIKVKELKIEQGSLNFIIGKIGSGKTAFLNSILNEMEQFNCQNNEDELLNLQNNNNKSLFYLKGEVCIVSQNSWLQTQTIKENILFGLEYNKEWYDQCVQACDLQYDFNQFHKGDEKVVYQGGINLSGGQRQRICICRALYAQKDIYLFDDIFSLIDIQVQEKIFQNMILKLLLKMGKTVLFSSSNYNILKYKNNVNQIILIDNGEIILEQQQIDIFFESQLINVKKPQENQLQKEQQQPNQQFQQTKESQEIQINSLSQRVLYPQIIIPFILCLSSMYYFYNQFSLGNQQLKRLNSVNKAKIITIINEVINGLITIRTFKQEKSILKNFIEKLNDYNNSLVNLFEIQVWLFIRIFLCSNIITISVCTVCLYLLFNNIDFNYANITLSFTYSLLFSQLFENLIYYQIHFQQNMVSMERINQYYQNEKENLNEKNEQKILDGQQFQIVFKNLFMSYDDNNFKYSLKNINLQIKKGEKVVFCGRTGSGKTSIFNLLFKLYPYQQGDIYIDNKSIKSFSLKELRQRISIIPQFSFLFKSNLKDNLDPNDEYSQEHIQQRIQQYDLKIQDSNSQSNIDLDFQIQEGGKNLSNGEKQIINFLRLSLKNSDIICIDEATSNMEPQTHQKIIDYIFKISEGQTLIYISHRIEKMELFDRIFVMEKGEIIEQGNYQDLIQIEEGHFNKLKQLY
ncbi:hypothetical protein IMG5_181250 [Ichthyophthirius multifiliis]|uniref:ABC transporter domain-containing protein n=1 Tax=Ichthyophthirius multifiliis TaxID=5932 RepID=G0R2S4_ICHMU|nr:hypothetical protein IMG5_181250 [Ichthyophthirius multifiliis]EGR28196.1 hypothetical protein IMG5_181250 [Ichthyophthirius multifiliis]|eukprot:XP_004027541.1 hypothetical protein IMG5_181250 [Ichthyophthirius multifiliis]